MNEDTGRIMSHDELENFLHEYGELHDANVAFVHKDQRGESIKISFDCLTKLSGSIEMETDEVLTFFSGVRQESVQESGEILQYSVVDFTLNEGHVFIQCNNGSLDFDFQFLTLYQKT
jgi:hypothetical protein